MAIADVGQVAQHANRLSRSNLDLSQNENGPRFRRGRLETRVSAQRLPKARSSHDQTSIGCLLIMGAGSLTEPVYSNLNELLTKSNRIVLTIAIRRRVNIFS